MQNNEKSGQANFDLTTITLLINLLSIKYSDINIEMRGHRSVIL